MKLYKIKKKLLFRKFLNFLNIFFMNFMILKHYSITLIGMSNFFFFYPELYTYLMQHNI